MDNWKRELVNKDESVAKKPKEIELEAEFQSNTMEL